MKELEELNNIAVPTISLIDDLTDAVLLQAWNITDGPDDSDEEMDAVADHVAEDQAKAIAAGQAFGKTEVASSIKAGRAKANAAGKFKLIGRGKRQQSWWRRPEGQGRRLKLRS